MTNLLLLLQRYKYQNTTSFQKGPLDIEPFEGLVLFDVATYDYGMLRDQTGSPNKSLDLYCEGVALFQECREKEAALREIDARLIANSMRLIEQSRELLLRLEASEHWSGRLGGGLRSEHLENVVSAVDA